MNGRKEAEASELFEAIMNGRNPSMDELLDVLGSHMPLLLKLKDTPQDSLWHAEGDVHIHTGMVLDALYEILGAGKQELSDRERLALVLGALLHDIAKPICTSTREKEGQLRIVSPGHEAKGRSLILQPLLDLGLDYGIVRDVMALVGYHQWPKLLVIKNSGTHAFRRLGRIAPLKLLYLLERADMMGRYCQDQREQLDYLDLYRMECETLGIWDEAAYGSWEETFLGAGQLNPDPDFKDLAFGEAILDHENGLISMPEEGLARSHKSKGGFGKLILMVGVSGSGKSTWAGRNFTEADVISLDDLRETMGRDRGDQAANGAVMQEARRKLKESLAARRTVVWDATSLRKDFRTQLMGLGRSYGALVTIVAMAKSKESWLLGNSTREHEVARSIQMHQVERLEWPEEDEAHRILVIGDRGEIVWQSGFL